MDLDLGVEAFEGGVPSINRRGCNRDHELSVPVFECMADPYKGEQKIMTRTHITQQSCKTAFWLSLCPHDVLR